ncbi:MULTISPECIES: DUF599 domain-containing protein [unclassified Ruegeria]|uniref:DUF599 domain-containing protein n=1 Tax=unclassified Ruegeria TaxID=2625375 RepID=UPI001ADCFED3|nr:MULTISPECIES: DUF599 domain-containing protein [unclassified Ruegeria]MBO9411851.1 DUF599 domain-containing protein [Ruegeria sp. R8_1]MBO9415588.1 DUF599 domain-containing protein [Ruegeria sp. R8_2]
MSWIDQSLPFAPLDFVGIALLIGAWLWIGWRIENPSPEKPSVGMIMDGYRRDWMKEMVTRQPRMFDAQVVGTMRQGSTFFASTTMIAIGGGLALLGNTERLAGLAQDLALGTAPALVWEVKILIILLFLANAFLKYVWAHRLFGYCAVLMAAVPNDPDDPTAYPRAGQAAEICVTAARAFNRGLRATYFALAAVAWILGPVALIAGTVATLAMLYRREFASHSRTVLLNTGS